MLGLLVALKNDLKFHKSDTNTGKVRCGVTNHLHVCCFSAIKFEYLQVQVIEKNSAQNDGKIDKVLWEREKNTGKCNYLR